MKKVFLFPLLAFIITQGMTAQVKLGDNPQSIDPASLFELESREQVLVITRVSNAELQAITPSMGALAYNTDEQCLFYHNGEVWVNLCEALGRAFTTDAIENEFPTIVITPLEDSFNFEVGEIRSENIVDFSIGSQDIQNNSINSEKLADASVGAAELQDNAVNGRNMDFVDITLSDFVNDVPFLVEGSLVAAAIFYDNTASGLSGSDIQAAIDLLSSGLDAVDLQAIGDGTYVFTRRDGTTTSFNLNASALPFSNTSNGFTATNVQGAIEEIQGSSSDDQTLTLNSPLLEIEDGNSVDLSGFLDNTDQQGLTLNGSVLAIENGNTVDLSGLTSGVNTDEQQITDFSFEPTTNTLTLEIENATSESVDLSALDQPAPDGSETRIETSPTVTVTGTGTAADPYQLASAGGADGSETIIQNTATVTVSGTGTAADPYLLTSAGGGADGSETIINNSSTVTVAGTGTTTDPYILTSTGGTGGADGSETILNSTATVLVSGTGTAADPYLLESTGGADGSETVIDDSATVTVSGTGTAADPYVLTSSGGSGGGDGSETIIISTATVTVAGTGTTADPYLLTSAGGAGDQIASEVPFSPIGNTISTDVQGAIEELQTDVDGLAGNAPNPNDELINTFELNGTSLEITEATVLLPPVDLDPVFATDAEVLSAITVSDAADGDTDPANEIQTLTSTDGSIGITQTGDDYDLSVTGSSDDQNLTGAILVDTDLTISIEDGTATVADLSPLATDVELLAAIAASDAADLDRLADNEIQIITSLDASVDITQTGNDYDLSVPLSPDDQNLTGATLTGTDLTISIEDGTATIADLSPLATDVELLAALAASDAADGDTNPVNEIQTITSTDASVAITQAGNDYDLSVPGSTDNQNLTGGTFIGTDLTITIEDGTSATVDLSTLATDAELAALSVDDADADPGNELQNITSSDGSVTITPNGDDFDLSVTLIPTSTSGALFYSDGAGSLVDNPTEIFWDQANNRLGIGTNNPQNKLQVTGEVRSQGYSNSNGTASEPSYAFTNDTDTGMWRGANTNFLRFSTQAIEAMTIDPAQNIGIGITSPTERLHVNGNILATGTITPDFVFEKYFQGASGANPEYEFQSLEEIYAYVQSHNHLPGVPSAREVSEQGGILVNRATEINLEKIEELFLHAIEQEKKIQSLQQEKETLNREVSELKLRLDRIEKAMTQKPQN